MPLDPEVQEMLAALAKTPQPAVNELSPNEARAQMAASSAALGAPEPIDSFVDRVVPGPDGEIPIRIYIPSGKQPKPVLVYFHGGGWVVGNIETHDGYCRSLANAADAVVVSVDYRLAPEHKYPAAADDAYTATKWVADNAESIGGRPGQLAVAGDSAGGNLAAVVSLMARDRGGPKIAYQVLIYPITDRNFDTSSYRDCATGYYLTRDAMIWFWEQYLPDASQGDEPYASPLRTESLAGLPPALVVTAEFDPLCDEGEAYAEKLRAAGVTVKLIRYDGMIHGFVRRLNAFRQARTALSDVASLLREAFHR